MYDANRMLFTKLVAVICLAAHSRAAVVNSPFTNFVKLSVVNDARETPAQIECRLAPTRPVCEGLGICHEDTCHCPPGRQGPYCQLAKGCPLDCGAGACNAAGKSGTVTCSCPDGLTGDGCKEAVRKCPSDCSGHGVCESDTEAVLLGEGISVFPNVCFCRQGWAGKACDAKQCAVVDGRYCGNNGSCADGECVCDSAWKGAACDESNCPAGCGDHGECAYADTCKCAEGFHGSDCSKLSCATSCGAHGDCQDSDGKCKCDRGWKSAGCTTEACPRECNRRLGWGSCLDFDHCKCAAGFEGDDCSTNTTALNNFGGSGDVYNPCLAPCLSRCDMTCAASSMNVFVMRADELVREELPKGGGGKEAQCLEKCALSCKQNCVQRLHELSKDDREDVTVQLPSLRGFDKGRPLAGKWTRDIYEKVNSVAEKSSGDP